MKKVIIESSLKTESGYIMRFADIKELFLASADVLKGEGFGSLGKKLSEELKLSVYMIKDGRQDTLFLNGEGRWHNVDKSKTSLVESQLRIFGPTYKGAKSRQIDSAYA